MTEIIIKYPPAARTTLVSENVPKILALDKFQNAFNIYSYKKGGTSI